MNNTKNNEIKNKFDNYTTNNIDYIKQYYSNNKISNNNYDIEQILTFSDLLLNNYLIWCCSYNI
jgi:hypothetical protein